MRHHRSIFVSLLLGAFFAPSSVFAQDLLPVVVIERPGGDSEVRQQTAGEFKMPRRLEWSAVLNSLDVVLELYGVECCDPPPQFTLHAGAPVYRRNGSGGALSLKVAELSRGGWTEPYSKSYGPSLYLDHPATLTVQLIDLRPNHVYVLDYWVDPPYDLFDVSGNQIRADSHLLVVVTTNSEGNAWVTIDNVEETDPRRARFWSMRHVVVSELQPAR